MIEHYITDQTFEKINVLSISEYENCTFKNCDFSDKNFSDYKFTDCTFEECNLSLIQVNNAGIRDVSFIDCKMLGIRLDECSDFGLAFSFVGCQLNHSSFYKMKLKNTTFKDSQLHEVDFTESDLTSATFDNCDLAGTVFDRTNLEKSDFRTSYNYRLDPDSNKVKKAKFSMEGLSGLLTKYGIIIK